MIFAIFDIDGTLTDTKEVEDRSFIQALDQTFGITQKNQNWETLTHVTDWGITEEIVRNELERSVRPEEYLKMQDSFISILEQERIRDSTQFAAVNGATHFFNLLKDDPKYRVGIATGAWGRSARLKLEAIGLDIEGVAFSNSDDHKSREEITKDVIRKLDYEKAQPKDQIVYFGDGLWDYKTCQNLNIRFIGIDINNDEKLKKAGAECVFTNFENIDLLKKAIVQVPT